MLDLGTGPGLLALGFAPHVGRVVGVDVEPAMLEIAREAAVRAGHDLTLIESPAEQMTDNEIDLVIGYLKHMASRGRNAETGAAFRK